MSVAWPPALLALVALSGMPRPVEPQVVAAPPAFLIDAETRVAAVDFRFPSGSTLDPSDLREGIAYAGPRGLAGVQRALDFIPGISPPELERFDPLVLQQDVARLRQTYRASGFPDVRVTYDVTLDRATNTVQVTFVIDQGRPVTLEGLDARPTPDAAADREIEETPAEIPLPPELVPDWTSYVADQRRRSLGDRLGAQEVGRLRDETTDWFLSRGYPWARVFVDTSDTTAFGIDATLEVSLGPRARIDSIATEGRELLSDRALRREIPIRKGDWFDATALAIGQTELFELDLVRRALGDVPPQPIDSTVSIRFRINESRPRLIWGRAGWRSESGFGGEAHWSHRDFLGGARTLTLSTNLETGWGGLEQVRGRSAGASALVKQPYVAHRSLSATAGPFLRYRDDFRDRSLLYGLESALLFRRAPLKTVTLQHEISRLRVDEPFRLLAVEDLLDVADDSTFAPIFVRNVFKLVGTYGELDDRLDPTSGFVVEPNLETAGPFGISDVEFFRLAVKSLVAVPLSRRVGLFLHATGGRLFPFGESAPPLEGASRARAIVGLRGVMFTAGGTSTVRGWGRGLVGPKIPEIELDADGNATADRWIPVGGLAELTGSVELAFPLPLLPEQHRSYLFLDGGRVWTPGSAFEPPDPELALEPWAFGFGGGLQFSTLFGPLRVGVGYKLNPSLVDLLSPAQVAGGLATGADLSALSTDGLRRWHLHFGIGRGL